MNLKLAKQLKAAGFPVRHYQFGHRFFPSETSAGWSQAARASGVTITDYELQDRLQDIKDGYYCPSLSDLIEACGESFGSLWIEKTIWTAQGKDLRKFALAHSAEEAVARLWLVLQATEPLRAAR